MQTAQYNWYTYQMSLFLRIIFILTSLLTGPLTTSSAQGIIDTAAFDSNATVHFQVAILEKETIETLNEDERVWYEKFQNGLLFFDGWQQISEDIINCIPPEEHSKTIFLLQTVGIKIGTEWSRENERRKIDTDQLRDWGRRLRKIQSNDPSLLLTTLHGIAREVDSLLIE